MRKARRKKKKVNKKDENTLGVVPENNMEDIANGEGEDGAIPPPADSDPSKRYKKAIIFIATEYLYLFLAISG